MDVKKTWNDYKRMFREAFTDLKTKGRRHRQIPNMLTATRLFAAPLFILPAALNKSLLWIVLFVTIFSLTDAFDGFIARRYGLVSDLGKDLDAICDKIFSLSLLVAASFFDPILLCNVLAEVVIAIINIRQKLTNKKPKSLYVGKIKTWVLYPLLGLAFAKVIVEELQPVFEIFLVASVCMQMLTISFYLIKYEKNTDEKDMVEIIEKEQKKIKKKALEKVNKKV